MPSNTSSVASPDAMRIETWPLDRLIPYARNPRKNDAAVGQMVSSIKEFGFKIPCLVRSDGEVVDGHLRLKAARKLGITEVPVILCDEWTPAQVKAFRLMVNRSVTWADWDEELLALELLDLQTEDFDLSLTGFGEEELERLLAAEMSADGLTDEDAVPEITETPISVPGDLWQLGNHRVLCGDATVVADVQRLMERDAADLVFTDPPYNVDYEGYTEDRLKIKGDKMTAEQFQHLSDRNIHFVPDHREARRFDVCLSLLVLATRVSERAGIRRLHRALPDHLGQEHVRVGFRPV